MLTFIYDDGTTKAVEVSSVSSLQDDVTDLASRVDNLEQAVKTQADGIAEFITSNNDSLTKVLSTLADVGLRVTRIEQVV